MTINDGDHFPDHADVSIHPPLFYLAMLAISYVLEHFLPLPVGAPGFGLTRAIGIILLLCGLFVIATGRRVMKKHATNINPTRPTTVIIQSGPYRFSRNPLYLALTVAYCGMALLINTWWPFLLLPLVLLSMHLLVVRKEERYLERKFGDVYLQYCSRVRRYF